MKMQWIVRDCQQTSTLTRGGATCTRARVYPRVRRAARARVEIERNRATGAVGSGLLATLNLDDGGGAIYFGDGSYAHIH